MLLAAAAAAAVAADNESGRLSPAVMSPNKLHEIRMEKNGIITASFKYAKLCSLYVRINYARN